MVPDCTSSNRQHYKMMFDSARLIGVLVIYSSLFPGAIYVLNVASNVVACKDSLHN